MVSPALVFKTSFYPVFVLYDVNLLCKARQEKSITGNNFLTQIISEHYEKSVQDRSFVHVYLLWQRYTNYLNVFDIYSVFWRSS